MTTPIVTREDIQPGDRIFTIEDRPVGSVHSVGDGYIEVFFEGALYRVPASEVFTSTNHQVTLQFSSSGLSRYRAAS